MVAKANSTSEKRLCRASGKINQVKPSKNIHKSEREKLKRGCENELFLELEVTLEPNLQNNGKATILSNAIRIIKDLLVQVESLRKENAALLNEEKYVRMERDELKEETVELAALMEKMQDELRGRKHNPVWENGSGCSGVIPIIPPQDLNPDQGEGTEAAHDHQVSRPRARYPNRSDSWLHDLQTCQDEGRELPSTVLSLF